MLLSIFILSFTIVTSYKILAAIYFPYLLKRRKKCFEITYIRLRKEINRYIEKSGVYVKNVYLVNMDEYRAILCGMGKHTSVFVSDKALMRNKIEEITALLAHEFGHYYFKHHIVGLILSIVKSGIAILGFCFMFCIGLKWHIAIILGLLTYILITYLYNYFIANPISRRQEYNADKYAAMTYDIQSMIDVLNRMTDNKIKLMRTHPYIVKRILKLHAIKFSQRNQAVKQ